MKKVLIITSHRVYNYGSALQAFATMQSVQKLGYDCQMVDYCYPTAWHYANALGNEHQNKITGFLRRHHCGGLLRLLKSVRQMILWRQFRGICKNHRRFDRFVDAMPATPRLSRREIRQNPPQGDIYLCGSDQIWNPRYMHTDNTYLLDFTPDAAKRISYASSFGIKAMLPQYADTYAALLRRFAHIGVREHSGCGIVRQLTGQPAEAVLDPTLLLTRQDWENHASRDHYSFDRPFILCYILLYFDPYPYAYELIDKIRQMTGYDVVFLSPDFQNRKLRSDYRYIFDAGPEEFLELYRKAAFVVAASFHATAFSINMNKNFFVITNPNPAADDRVANLLRDVGLESRGLRKGTPLDFSADDLKIDYTEPERKLAELRQRSMNFLEGSLRD